jgi:hypothetical protein
LCFYFSNRNPEKEWVCVYGVDFAFENVILDFWNGMTFCSFFEIWAVLSFLLQHECLLCVCFDQFRFFLSLSFSWNPNRDGWERLKHFKRFVRMKLVSRHWSDSLKDFCVQVFS